MSSIFNLDPLKDPRWDLFLERHPCASVFHSVAWLEALHRTYGYEPIVYTSSSPDSDLENGLVFCHIDSWLTGRRLVSLPFSDHCEPLLDKPEALPVILHGLQRILAEGRLKSIEIRPLSAESPSAGWADFRAGASYRFHRVDLRPNLNQLFRNLQKDSIQRKIRRAEREGLVYEEGRSESLLEEFYRLMLITRRRHELPPPSLDWFRNLLASLGEKSKIRIASKDGQAVAAVVVLSYKQRVFYKYGCSDSRFHNLGGMPFLLWKTIEDAKRNDASELDLGRSDVENSGLIQFKERLGATGSPLTYLTYPSGPQQATGAARKMKFAKQIFSYLPDRMLVTAGKLLYPHIG